MNSTNDMKKMQEEAAKKVREMHNKSKFLNDSESSIKPAPKPKSEHRDKPISPVESLSQILFKDTEKSLVLILMIILMDSEENLPVILALLSILI